MKLMMQLLLIYCLFVSVVSAQGKGEVVATAGNVTITADEFSERFNFMPRLHFSEGNQDSVKKEFLLSLIAEKLWAMKAHELGYDTLNSVRHSVKALEVLLLKDELYRSHVLPKVIITEDELKEALQFAPLTLTVGVIASKDLAEISNYYQRLLNGEEFTVLQMERKAQGYSADPVRVMYGSLSDENLERQVFRLHHSSISNPVASEGVYYIFKIFEIETDSMVQENTERLRNIAFSRLSERRERRIAGSVLDSLLGGMSVRMSESIVDSLSRVWFSHLVSDTIAKFPYEVPPARVMHVLHSLPESFRKEIIAALNDEAFTLESFLYSLFSHNVLIAEKSVQSVKTSILSHLKGFVEDRILATRALRYDLDKSSGFISSTTMWKQHYLSDLLMQHEMQQAFHFVKNETQSGSGVITQVNIQEILANSPQIIDTVLQLLNAGVSFETLAAKYNTRQTTLQTNGVWGFFNPRSAGELGRIAEKLQVGDIYGPLITAEGLSLFKVLEKKEVLLKDKDSVLPALRSYYTQIDEALNKRTADLAKGYGISINERVLNEIEVSPLRSFTYRLIGFGGRIAAHPFTTPLYHWYQEYLQQNLQP